MPQAEMQNRRFILAERLKGEPTLATLRLETVPVPQKEPDQMLLVLRKQLTLRGFIIFRTSGTCIRNLLGRWVHGWLRAKYRTLRR